MDHFALILIVSVLLGFTTAQQKANCPNGWTASTSTPNKCYRIFDSNVAWYDAHATCLSQATGGAADLVSIHSAFENSEIRALTAQNQLATENLWIGLNEPTADKYIWSDGTSVDYTNWVEGEPNPLNQCTTINGRSFPKWSTLDCNVGRSFVCELKLTPPCPQGWVYDADFSACYKVFEKQELTWYESAVQCRRLNATLADVRSSAEGDFVASIISNDNYWIGLFSMNSNATNWLWSNGQLPGYYRWNAGKPDNRHANCCTQMIGRNDPVNYGKWTNEACSTQLSFVCKRPARGTQACTTD